MFLRLLGLARKLLLVLILLGKFIPIATYRCATSPSRPS